MTVTQAASHSSMVGPDELVGTLDDVTTALSSLRLNPSTGPLEGWAEVVSACQRIVNVATAVQDEAIVALCAIETTEDDDGTLRQWHKVPGHVSLDGPAIVSNALDVTAVHAERRVRDAVRLAADGQAGTTTCTGLGALHDAKRSGALDAYRAGVVAFELEEAPPEVAETIIAALGENLTHESGPQLRRRCRRLIARISPDLLRQRAKRAREECGLRRWVDQPGVDRWEATFPSEDAAAAWAPIDARAQELMRDGKFDRIERARGQALVDLIKGNATITTVVTLTVPADDPRVVTDTEPSAALAATTTIAHPAGPTAAPAATTAVARTATPRPHGPSSTEVWTSRDQHRRHRASAKDDLVEVANPLGGEPMLVSRGWVDSLLNDPETLVRTATCDPDTGALGTDASTSAYRPTAELARTVGQRDGRCRFPGCHVAARFCDLDHVRPWPTGPTTDRNLICLCRRHHRIKQRPGWHVKLHPDGTVTWTDPTGRTRTTMPIDALHGLVLPAGAAAARTDVATFPTRALRRPETASDDEDCTDRPTAEAEPTADPGAGTSADGAPASRPGTTDAFSSLEFALEHLLGETPLGRGTHRRNRTTVTTVPAHDLLVELTPRPCRARDPHQLTSWDLDEPPF